MKSNHKNVNIIRYDLEKQQGGLDCGVYAIAYAVSVSQEEKPKTLKFNQKLMRHHLISCLEKKQFTVLSSAPLQSENRKNPIIKEMYIFCNCRLPHDDSNLIMIECSKCEELFNFSCVNISEELKIKLNSSNDRFYCSEFCKRSYIVIINKHFLRNNRTIKQ